VLYKSELYSRFRLKLLIVTNNKIFYKVLADVEVIRDDNESPGDKKRWDDALMVSLSFLTPSFVILVQDFELFLAVL
jgi:hypothetical protein